MGRAAAAAEGRDRHRREADEAPLQLSFFHEADAPPSPPRRPKARAAPRSAGPRSVRDRPVAQLPVPEPVPKAAAQSAAVPRPAPAVPPAPAPAPRPARPFGTWLLQQEGRADWIGLLARGARADRAFPRAGDPEAVRRRLSDSGAEADMFEALDAAESAWMGS